MKKTNLILLMILVLSLLVSSTACLRYTSNIIEITRPAEEPSASIPVTVPVTETQTLPLPSETAASTTEPVVNTTLPPQVTQPPTTAAPETTRPAETTTANTRKDPSQWTKEEILANLTKAINSSKAYTGQMTVEHTEDFTFEITKCPGGKIGINLANRIASGVLKPRTEMLTFNGGTTVDSDGKTVPLLLPKRQNFALSAAGIKSAKAFQSGSNTVIEITLVSEHGTIDTPPKYNAQSMGYLDSHDLDLSLLTITTFDVVYSGSSMIVNIDAQGRVSSASYDIPIAIEATGSALGFSGAFACNGAEKEIWKLNW